MTAMFLIGLLIIDIGLFFWSWPVAVIAVGVEVVTLAMIGTAAGGTGVAARGSPAALTPSGRPKMTDAQMESVFRAYADQHNAYIDRKKGERIG